MIQGLLKRFVSDDQGTLGLLRVGSFSCFILELPWRDNRRQVSHIPDGTYTLMPHTAPRFGQVYWFQAVPGRSEVLTHSGAFAGDKALGWLTHSAGCLLTGKYYGKFKLDDGRQQRAVFVSRPTLRLLIEYLEFKPWKLEIVNEYHPRTDS